MPSVNGSSDNPVFNLIALFSNCSLVYFIFIDFTAKMCRLMGDSVVMFLKHRVCCKNRNVIYFRDFGKINTLHSFIFINKYDYILR